MTKKKEEKKQEEKVLETRVIENTTVYVDKGLVTVNDFKGYVLVVRRIEKPYADAVVARFGDTKEVTPDMLKYFSRQVSEQLESHPRLIRAPRIYGRVHYALKGTGFRNHPAKDISEFFKKELGIRDFRPYGHGGANRTLHFDVLTGYAPQPNMMPLFGQNGKQ